MSAPLPVGEVPDEGLIAKIVEATIVVRAVEAALARLSASGRVGPVQGPGRAARAMIAAAHALGPRDVIFGTPRDWPAAFVRGVDVKALMLQAAARAGSLNLGRTLPGALDDGARGVTLSASTPAAHLLHAVGFGTAARVRRDDRVALALFGVGGFSYGDAHAAFSAAPVHRAHTVFVARGPLGDDPSLAEVAAAAALWVEVVDADDGAALYAAVAAARARAIGGEGPTLVDARYRPGAPRALDVGRLQRAGRLSSEAERAIDAEIRASLWRGRSAMERAGAPPIDTLEDHLRAPAPVAPAEQDEEQA
ncbi:MAG: hypothetical protein CSA66_04020 [Proteobacteria bacterium]|nr:MAG: hypothetical protein CSA66_04020 [Pseudomonadota bacterium]